MGDLLDLQFQVLSQQSRSRELPPLNFPLPGAIVPPALPDYVQPDSTKITSLPNGFQIASQTSESTRNWSHLRVEPLRRNWSKCCLSFLFGIQVVKGPGGKLWYPSRPSHKLLQSWFFRELGDFQCYDKDTGSSNTPYGEFLFEWYAGMLLLHGDRICREAASISRHTELDKSARVAGIHWHYQSLIYKSFLKALSRKNQLFFHKNNLWWPV